MNKILKAIVVDPRASISDIAKRCKMSRELASYHIKKLEKSNIILGYSVHLQPSALGLIGGVLFISLKKNRHEEFIELVKKSPEMCWACEHVGPYHFGSSIYAKSSDELAEKVNKILSIFSHDVIDSLFLMHHSTILFQSKFVGVNAPSKMMQGSISTDDMSLVRELVNNSRNSIVQIATNLKLSAPTVVKRISGLVSKHLQPIVLLNQKEMGFQLYSIFFQSVGADASKLLEACRTHPQIYFACQYIESDYFEIGVFVGENQSPRNAVIDLQTQFPALRVRFIQYIEKEIKPDLLSLFDII